MGGNGSRRRMINRHNIEIVDSLENTYTLYLTQPSYSVSISVVGDTRLS